MDRDTGNRTMRGCAKTILKFRRQRSRFVSEFLRIVFTRTPQSLSFFPSFLLSFSPQTPQCSPAGVTCECGGANSFVLETPEGQGSPEQWTWRGADAGNTHAPTRSMRSSVLTNSFSNSFYAVFGVHQWLPDIHCAQ